MHLTYFLTLSASYINSIILILITYSPFLTSISFHLPNSNSFSPKQKTTKKPEPRLSRSGLLAPSSTGQIRPPKWTHQFQPRLPLQQNRGTSSVRQLLRLSHALSGAGVVAPPAACFLLCFLRHSKGISSCPWRLEDSASTHFVKHVIGATSHRTSFASLLYCWRLLIVNKAVMGSTNLRLFASFVKEGWEKAFIVAKFFCFLHVTDSYLVTPVQTYGPSMLPTIEVTPSVFIAEMISTRFDKLASGDIIVLCSPENPRKFMIKRLFGVEGDRVTYIPNPDNIDKHETVVVPKGHVWVQGDNMYKSRDSRNFGPVPYGLIQSKIFWKAWPLKDFGPFWKN